MQEHHERFMRQRFASIERAQPRALSGERADASWDLYSRIDADPSVTAWHGLANCAARCASRETVGLMEDFWWTANIQLRSLGGLECRWLRIRCPRIDANQNPGLWLASWLAEWLAGWLAGWAGLEAVMGDGELVPELLYPGGEGRPINLASAQFCCCCRVRLWSPQTQTSKPSLLARVDRSPRKFPPGPLLAARRGRVQRESKATARHEETSTGEAGCCCTVFPGGGFPRNQVSSR